MPVRVHNGLKKRCACGARKWAKCIHPWHFSFHHHGREHRHSLDVVAHERCERPPSSKSEAEAWRDRLRAEIRRGDFPSSLPPTEPAGRLTFADLVRHYRERYVHVPTRRARAAVMFEVHLKMLLRSEVPGAHGSVVMLAEKPVDMVTKADIEHIRTARRAALAAAAAADPSALNVRRPGAKRGEVGINRLLARLRHVFSWAIAEGYVQETPFKRQGVTVIRLAHQAETVRDRRLQLGEESKLLEHATADFRALIVAALSTGCRLGELLSLQWSQVRCDEAGAAVALALPAGRTKTNQARVIPVGARLRAVLELRRHAPDGQPHPLSAYVFGNACGEPTKTIRAAWERTCRLAGVQSLHFHDLRREFACRLLESSADLHDVRDFLGHANITTTSTYLASTPARLAKALARLDEAGSGEPVKVSHTIRTNEGENENGRTNRPTVSH